MSPDYKIEKEKDNQILDTSSFLNEMKGEEIIELLKAGEVFIKYGNYGNPHLRVVKLTEDEKRLTWYTQSSCSIFKKVKFLEVTDV